MYTHTPGVYNPPANAHYTQLDVPDKTDVGVLIGTDGRHFNRITQQSGCDYIWYDDNRNVIEVWGPEDKLFIALFLLKDRIKTLTSYNS